MLSDGADRHLSAIGGMATIPERQSALSQCIPSIVDQLDHLHVYLNGFSEVPGCLKHPRISAHLSSDHVGDLGDAGKFFGYALAEQYYLALDDDFVYPPDYVREMVCAAQRHPEAAAVGIHGVRLPEKCQSYRRDRQVFGWNRNLALDVPVHILGTGVICFNVPRFAIAMDVFRTKNMADLWIGVLAQQRQTPLICVAHRRHWLQSLPVQDSIYDQMRTNDSRQTEVIGTVPRWELWSEVHTSALRHTNGD